LELPKDEDDSQNTLKEASYSDELTLRLSTALGSTPGHASTGTQATKVVRV
jgi:hypothetical protein